MTRPRTLRSSAPCGRTCSRRSRYTRLGGTSTTRRSPVPWPSGCTSSTPTPQSLRNYGGNGMNRQEALARLRREVEAGRPIIGAGAGTGLSAKCAEAGGVADVLVPHMGLTTSGTIGAQTAISLDEAVQRVQAMHDAATEVNPAILVLCHGGPIALPEDAAYVLERTRGVVGFFGASSM